MEPKQKQKGHKRRETRVRKKPSQARSKERYELMLSAAAAVLEQEGYDRLGTVTIAERAGVSVGSVYQFFPNKHAVLSVLLERWLSLDNEALAKVEASRDKYESVTDEFVHLAEVLVKTYKRHKSLLALVPLIPNIPELYERTEAHDKDYAKRLAVIMDRHELKADTATRLALAGYYTIIVDAAGMSIANETRPRARLKATFLLDSVRDLFSHYT